MNPVRDKTSEMPADSDMSRVSNGMKVLMISGDTKMLTAGSEAHQRLALQRSHVDQLDVFVWPQVHSWREIAETSKVTRYDVITAQDPFWRGFLAWRLARRAGAKLNLQVHTDLSAQSLARRWLAHFLLRRADSVRVVSEKIREQLQTAGIKAPIHVLPIYVDIQRFKNIQPQQHTKKTMLWIGRFEAEKAPLKALKALQEVLEQGVAVRLIMLGAGSLEAKLHTAAKGLPVEFPGWKDPAEYLPTADVVLCTSRHESWGASIVEALAAGVPVVAPDVGIAREAGAYIADRDAFSSKIIEVLQQEARGTLRLNLPTAEEWAEQWEKTLV